MTELCPSITQMLSQANAVNIYDYLCTDLDNEAVGLAAMQWLGANRPSVRNSVLCYFYDVACYHVGTSCFADTAPAEEQDKWFVSVLSGSELDLRGLDIALADSKEDAEALAVKEYSLVAKFFGSTAQACIT